MVKASTLIEGEIYSKRRNHCVLVKRHTNFLELFVLLIVNNSGRGSMKAPEHVSLGGCVLVTLLNLFCNRNILPAMPSLALQTLEC